jgi:beclin 1
MCIECTTLLQVELQKELEELSRERDAYIEFQKGVLRNRDSLAKKHSHGKTARTRAKRDSEDEEEGLGEYDMEGTPEEWDELVKRKKELEEEEEELTRLLAEKERELEKAREEEHRVKEEEAEMDKREDE